MLTERDIRCLSAAGSEMDDRDCLLSVSSIVFRFDESSCGLENSSDGSISESKALDFEVVVESRARRSNEVGADEEGGALGGDDAGEPV